MNVILNGVSVLLATFSAYVVTFNYGAIIVSSRNKRRGIDRHISMGYVLPQICLLLAHFISSFAPDRFIPPWLLLAIALADPSLWCLAALPIFLLCRR